MEVSNPFRRKSGKDGPGELGRPLTRLRSVSSDGETVAASKLEIDL